MSQSEKNFSQEHERLSQRRGGESESRNAGTPVQVARAQRQGNGAMLGQLSINPTVMMIIQVLLGAAVVGLLAQVSVPLWPVPVTGQTLGVLLVGAALGPRRGAAAMVAYMLLGIVGVPWFADFTGGIAAVLKPSFGFIIGFIPSAYVSGKALEGKGPHSLLKLFGWFTLATVLPFVFGLPYMWAVLYSLGKTLSFGGIMSAGLVPFIPGGIIKAALATIILRVFIIARRG